MVLAPALPLESMENIDMFEWKSAQFRFHVKTDEVTDCQTNAILRNRNMESFEIVIVDRNIDILVIIIGIQKIMYCFEGFLS